jgi:hypothetical protein
VDLIKVQEVSGENNLIKFVFPGVKAEHEGKKRFTSTT